MYYSKTILLPLGLLILLVFPFTAFGSSDGKSEKPFSEATLASSGTRLPDVFGQAWKALGPVRSIANDGLASLPESELMSEYGLQNVRTRKYSSKESLISIEVLEFKHSAGAYGFWTIHRGQLPANRREIVSGRFVVSFVASQERMPDEAGALIDVYGKESLLETEIPFLPGYLPEQDRVPESEKYFLGPRGIAGVKEIMNLKDSIDFTGGTHAVSAEYVQGSGRMTILLIEYQTPQFGTDGAAKLQQQFEALTPEEKKSRMVRRIGNYVVEAIGFTDPKAAESLLGKIKYMPRVYWEGKDIKAVPLEYRPPDPWLIDESIRTGKFVVAAFYWIGLMGMIAIMTGIFSGAAYFYWRRSRTPALGDEFSDAGGLTKLNLDEALLSGSDPARRMLGSGE